DAAGWRARVDLNFFWADCPDRLCRRKQCCRSADPEHCFHYNWAGLDENKQRFRAAFMEAFARLRDPHEAMVEVIARALMRSRKEGARRDAGSSIPLVPAQAGTQLDPRLRGGERNETKRRTLFHRAATNRKSVPS